jgi:hypothetical protein
MFLEQDICAYSRKDEILEMRSTRELFSIFLDTLTDLSLVEASCTITDDSNVKATRIQMARAFKKKTTEEAKRWIWESVEFDRTYMKGLMDVIKGRLSMHLDRYACLVLCCVLKSDAMCNFAATRILFYAVF